MVFKLMFGGNSAPFAPAADSILHCSPSTSLFYFILVILAMLEELIHIVFDIPFSYVLGAAELRKLTDYVVDEPTLADPVWARTLDGTAMCLGPCCFCNVQESEEIVPRDPEMSVVIPRAH